MHINFSIIVIYVQLLYILYYTRNVKYSFMPIYTHITVIPSVIIVSVPRNLQKIHDIQNKSIFKLF